MNTIEIHEVMGGEKYCCCTCANRVNDYSHPHTNGKNVLTLRGYICSTGELGNFSGWPEHSGCELHYSRPERPENDRVAENIWDSLYKEKEENIF